VPRPAYRPSAFPSQSQIPASSTASFYYLTISFITK